MAFGQQVERTFADICLAEVAAGQPRTLVVRGQPGAGKTRLLDHVATEAGRAGFRVLRARAADRGRPHRSVTLLGVLLDTLPATAGPLAVPPGPDVVRALLGLLATGGPVLLVLDDAQWAEPWTVALVDGLVRLPVAGPVLLAVALRSGEPDPALRSVLDAVERSVLASSIELGPPRTLAACRPARCPW